MRHYCVGQMPLSIFLKVLISSIFSSGATCYFFLRDRRFSIADHRFAKACWLKRKIWKVSQVSGLAFPSTETFYSALNVKKERLFPVLHC